MGPIILAVFVIVLGAVIRVAGPASGKPGAAGSAKLAGYGLMLAGLVLMVSNGVTVIGVGEVGVKHFLGSIDSVPLDQGVHVINPLASIEKMSIREQAYPQSGGVELIEAQTSEQLNVSLEISILFRLDGANSPDLFQRLGSEEQIKRSIVLNAVRNGVRDAVATKSINQIFSPDRREVADDMLREIQAKAGDRIEVLDVFVRDVQAPPTVRQAQNIISAGLTPAYLTFHYIEKLSTLPAGSVVYVPTEGGIPLMRSLGGGN